MLCDKDQYQWQDIEVGTSLYQELKASEYNHYRFILDKHCTAAKVATFFSISFHNFICTNGTFRSLLLLCMVIHFCTYQHQVQLLLILMIGRYKILSFTIFNYLSLCSILILICPCIATCVLIIVDFHWVHFFLQSELQI